MRKVCDLDVNSEFEFDFDPVKYYNKFSDDDIAELKEYPEHIKAFIETAVNYFTESQIQLYMSKITMYLIFNWGCNEVNYQCIENIMLWRKIMLNMFDDPTEYLEESDLKEFVIPYSAAFSSISPNSDPDPELLKYLDDKLDIKYFLSDDFETDLKKKYKEENNGIY